MGKAYTISCSRDHHAEEHSRRSYTPMSAEWSLRNENVVIFDCGNDRKHFNDFFRPAIENYNAKQKRKDRKKDLDYLSALEDGREGFGKGEKKEKPFYHSVIQIGNSETNGVTDASFDKHHWRQLKAEEKYKEAAEYVRTHLNRDPAIRDFKEILTEIGQEILENRDGRYDGVLVHGLTLHCDEPAGTIHLDLRATFYCDGEKTGVSKRVSQNKALKKLGFVTTPEKTNLTKFEEAIKDRVAEKMKERGYEREIVGEHRPHERTEVFQLRKDAEEAEKRLKDAEAEVKEIDNQKMLIDTEWDVLFAAKASLAKQKTEWEADFKKTKADWEEDFEKMRFDWEEDFQNHIQQRVADFEAREEELVRREAVLKKKEKSLDVERRTFTKEQQAYEELLDDKYDEIKNEYKIMLFKLNPKLFGARDRYIGKSKTIQDFRDEFVSEAITYIEDLQKEFDRVKAERQKVLEEQKKVEKIRAEYEAKESELSKRVAEMAEDLFNQRMKIENERKGLQHKDYFDIK